MTAADLGAYKNAYLLAAFPAQMLGQVMDRVIFPVISRFQKDRHAGRVGLSPRRVAGRDHDDPRVGRGGARSRRN